MTKTPRIAKILMSKSYSSEELCDVERDVYEALNEADLPVDEHGFNPGEFTVTIVWDDDAPS